MMLNCSTRKPGKWFAENVNLRGLLQYNMEGNFTRVHGLAKIVRGIFYEN